MFYRVKVNDQIQGTTVWDDSVTARGVFDVMKGMDEGAKVTFETVLDDGTVVYTETREGTTDPAELAHREYARKNGYNEHGFKVGSF
jgi:hypothetical protein